MKRTLAAILVATQITGCATIAHRSAEPIEVQSDPPGAAAVIECRNGVRVEGETPARLLIPRKATGCTLTVAGEGLPAQTISLRRGVSGKFWGEFWTALPAVVIAASANDSLENIGLVVVYGTIGLAALVGALVDLATGRLWAHDPDDIELKLEPAP